MQQEEEENEVPMPVALAAKRVPLEGGHTIS
jgi:hypothetical protein